MRAGSRPRHAERHRSGRSGWLRAAVLGANDGIVSVASLVLGVAAGGAGRADVLLAGVAGAVAGALSMAAGEYVSVSSQADAEAADLDLERRELERDPQGELDELTAIYVTRGLSPPLARRVAEELSRGDRLAVHAREELGLDEGHRARPWQAATASAAAFSAGAALPVLATLAPGGIRSALIVVVTVLALALLGAAGAVLGGASPLRAAGRVVLWGLVAMALTSLIGAVVGAAV